MTKLTTGSFPAEDTTGTLATFESLGLSPSILRAVSAEGYTTPTPIQEQAIPQVVLRRDLFGIAQTGTGKTAAFALPILDRLSGDTTVRRNKIRALVLSPTRELAVQIHDAFRTYGKFARMRTTAIYGGVHQNPQTRALRQGVDILIATPGRLIDLMKQGYVDLSALEVFVLDEADRMFDMGFINDVRRVVGALPPNRQTLLFSATMPDAIKQLANEILTNPVTVEVTPVSTRAEHIEQTVYLVEKAGKPDLLTTLLAEADVTRAIVFTRTKHGADKLVRHLERSGVRADSIHGDKSQNARQKALDGFRRLSTRVLVATDLAARGLDIDEISHVINYDLPVEPETYVHRIGRTARAGASGIAFSFCDSEERGALFAIQRLLREPIPVMRDGVRHEAGVAEPARAPRTFNRSRPPFRGNGGPPRGGRPTSDRGPVRHSVRKGS
jgi:ATP-dependent RNA helicase RhlE